MLMLLRRAKVLKVTLIFHVASICDSAWASHTSNKPSSVKETLKVHDTLPPWLDEPSRLRKNYSLDAVNPESSPRWR